MPERHTAEYLANVLQPAVEDWGIDDRVAACVYDNAYNKLNGFINKFCGKEAHSINIRIIINSRPTPTHFAYCKLTWDIVNVHNPALFSVIFCLSSSNALLVCFWVQPLQYDGRATVLKESADPLSSATAAAAAQKNIFIDLSTHDSNTSTHKILSL